MLLASGAVPLTISPGTYELRRGDDRSSIANTSLTHTSRTKLTHDAEQFLYLASRHRNARRFELLAKNYEDISQALTDTPARLTPAQRDVIGEDYNTAINVFGAAEVTGPAINPNFEPATVSNDLTDNTVAIIDDLLTVPALTRLQRFLLESTIWHDFSHIAGFVASYLEDGLASPLLLQIIDEFRSRLPNLLGDKPLTQAWAFKGLEPASTIALHADDAALSLNLWLTPNDANLSPNCAGAHYLHHSPA